MLRIMAGVDQEFQGEAWAAKGTKIGYLPQEPQLDATRDVRGNVELAVEKQRKLLDRFNGISAKFAEPMTDNAMQKLLDEQAKVQEQIDAHDLWNLDNKIEIAMDALRTPPSDADVRRCPGEKRRVALCRVLSRTRHACARGPTNHLDAESVAWLERYSPSQGMLLCRDARSLLPGQRCRWILELDRGRGIPYEALHRLARTKKDAPRHRGEIGVGAPALARARARMGGMSPARVRQRTRRAFKVRGDCDEAQNERVAQNEIQIPPPPRLATTSSSPDLRKAYATSIVRRTLARTAAGDIVESLAPTAAGKTTLFRMITGSEKPDAGSLKFATRAARLRGPIAPSSTAKSRWGKISGGREQIMVGRRNQLTRVPLELQLQGADQHKKVGALSAASGTAAPRQDAHDRRNVLLLDEPTNDSAWTRCARSSKQ